ncbi:MAG: DUF2436 domain-containing protein [Dysgonamonadaceae bacterium]|jgi:hypothetical protein|nr:DUF2436 domain-containing protein [Dysgonamonadaceae bacterium]
MRQSITLLTLAFILGLNLTAQNSNPTARFTRANDTKTGLTQEKQPAPSANPKAFERVLREKRTGFPGIKDGKTILPGENATTRNPETFRLWETGKAPAKKSPSLRVVKSANEDVATITFRAGDPYEDGTGFQMLLDADHEIDFSRLYDYAWLTLDEMSEYSIPVNANADWDNLLALVGETVSITVPEGLYDILIANYHPDFGFSSCYWLYGNYMQETNIDDWFFKAGYEYIFINETSIYIEYQPEIDATLTRLVLPDASPDLTDSEEIGVRLSNTGRQAISSITLSYQINDGEPVTETYSKTLEPREEDIYTFNTKADFSGAGLYNVTAWLTSEEDMNPLNNQRTGTTKHSGALPLPYTCDFDTQADLFDWEIINFKGGAYFYDSFTGDGSLQLYNTYEDTESCDIYLRSSDPLIFPEAGTYHIAFQVIPNGPEKFSVLYGTSPDVEEMQVLEEYTFEWSMDWLQYAINFSVPEAGNYYIAFRYYSPSDYECWSVSLDNILVGEGRSGGSPDLSFDRLLLPASSCSLPADAVLGARIRNRGNKEATELTLTYQVNGGTPVSQTFDETIGIQETKDIYFDQSYDFSTLGNYEIKLTVSNPEEENLDDNRDSIIISHYEPLAELPFESNFANQADRTDWTSTIPKGWIPDIFNYGCLFPTVSVPLLSRCLTLQPGDYRFTYRYSAGLHIESVIFYDNFYVAYGPAGSDPSGWTKSKEYTNKTTGGAGYVEEDNILLHITEAGEYVVGIFPKTIGDLAVYTTSITVVEEHDVRISKVESPVSFTRQTPQKQVAGEHTFIVTLQNRGINAGVETGSIELKMNDEPIATENFTVDAGEEKIISLSATFPALPVGSLNLDFIANMESDQNPEDNTLRMTKIVSDSTYALDNVDSNFIDYFGPNREVVGLIYELKQKDVLTSINVGLVSEYTNLNFGLAVYSVDEDLVIGDPYFDVPALCEGGSSIAFDVPDTELEPGKYFFSVRQLTSDNIFLTYDPDPNGYFYAVNNGVLDLIDGSTYRLGFIHVRPNFGNTATALPEVKEANPALQLYPNPVVDHLTVRTAGQQIEKISVYDIAGASVYREEGINSSEYKLNTGHLASGLYFITVQTPAGVKTDKFIVR